MYHYNIIMNIANKQTIAVDSEHSVLKIINITPRHYEIRIISNLNYDQLQNYLQLSIALL
jgi:hypothetical protein